VFREFLKYPQVKIGLGCFLSVLGVYIGTKVKVTNTVLLGFNVFESFFSNSFIHLAI